MGLASSQSWALLSIWGVNFINVIIYIERHTHSSILKFFACLLLLHIYISKTLKALPLLIIFAIHIDCI